MNMATTTVTEQVRLAKEHAEEELLFAVAAQADSAESGSYGYGFENIVGVSIGERHVSGRPTGVPAVTVYVMVKAGREAVEPSALIPAAFDGVPTDVVEAGEFVANSERGRFRPAHPGVSVAHSEDTAGTLGFIARRENVLYIVSNNHVLARENEASRGAVIVQPGPRDGGTAEADKIAQLSAWLPLSFDGRRTPVDAAIAETESSLVVPQVPGAEKMPAKPFEAQRGVLVRKSGRTTSLTRGYVRDIDATVKVRYRRGTVFLSDQLVVKGLEGERFSEGGDSGALVIEERTHQPIGLLCAGSPRFSLVTPIERVLEGLELSFVA